MFENFLKNESSWLGKISSEESIIISSRIRLARNLADYPFPNRASTKDRYEVLDRVKTASLSLEELSNAIFVKIEDLNDLDRQFLLERHIISQDHVLGGEGRGLVVRESEDIALMINEEDHIRLQILAPGLELRGIWDKINYLDDALSKRLSFAFLPDLGYLTSCPTNVGTALRASCMLHLPGLVITKRINRILELLAKLSFATRGLFGEGTQALGNFFQISNQVSLGLSEEELIDNLYGIVKQVKDQEEQARQSLLKRQRIILEDSIWRSFGILKNARLITTKEAFSHLSMLYLGVDLGIIKNICRDVIRSLFVIIQPAHLQKIKGEILDDKERDYLRAKVLREKLGG